jgi:hypothetical protein
MEQLDIGVQPAIPMTSSSMSSPLSRNALFVDQQNDGPSRVVRERVTGDQRFEDCPRICTHVDAPRALPAPLLGQARIGLPTVLCE